MNRKISVIIPIYNVEEYLHRCVDSVLNQTYKDLEVILVDDGSPDGCPQICDDYAKKDRRVKVIHKKNGGLSSARNAALDAGVEGDYIGFVDSDDWILPEFYEYCLKLMDSNNADVVQIDFAISNDGQIPEQNSNTERIDVFDGKDILQHYMDYSTATGSYGVWRNLFKKSTIGRLRFRDGKVNEDMDWKYMVLSNCKRMVESNQKKYIYLMSSMSISKGGLRKRDFDLYEASDLLQHLTSGEEYGTIAFLGRVKRARTAFSLLSKIAYYGVADKSLNEKSLVRQLTREHRKNVKTLLVAPIPWSRKVLTVLFAINFTLAKLVIRAGKRIVNYI